MAIELNPNLGSQDSAYAADVNSRGCVVGSRTLNGLEQAIIWTPDPASRTTSNPYPFVATNIGRLSGDARSLAHRINASSEVAGYSEASGGGQRTFFWAPGQTLADIGNLGGSSTFPWDINDSGTIVGKSTGSSGQSFPFRKLKSVSIESLSLYPQVLNGNGAAQAINGTGSIAGYAQQDTIAATNYFCHGIWSGSSASFTDNPNSNTEVLQVHSITSAGLVYLTRRVISTDVHTTYSWSSSAGFTAISSFLADAGSAGGYLVGRGSDSNYKVRKPDGTLIDFPSNIASYSGAGSFTSAHLTNVSDEGIVTGTYDTAKAFIAIPVYSSITATVTVNLENLSSGASSTGKPVEWQLRKGGITMASGTANLSSSSAFTLSCPLRDTVTLLVKARHWLRKETSWTVAESASSTSTTINLLNGDVDRDNVVSVFDYIWLSDHMDASSSDSDWDTLDSNGLAPSDADLDEDNTVSVFDYIILSDNFDQQGAV